MLSRNELKKHVNVTTIVLVGLLIYLLFWGMDKHRQVKILEDQITETKYRLVESTTVPLDHAFDQVIEQSTKENMTLLFHSIRNQTSRIRSFITIALQKEEIRTSLGKKHLLNYQLAGDVLLNRDELSDDEIEIIKQMKEAWKTFHQEIGPRYYWVDGHFILGAYVKLS